MRPKWPNLVLEFGLAALITSISTFASSFYNDEHARVVQQCAIAVQLVQGDKVSPSLSDAERRLILGLAARRVERCLKD